jgi:hypothetical protein
MKKIDTYYIIGLCSSLFIGSLISWLIFRKQLQMWSVQYPDVTSVLIGALVGCILGMLLINSTRTKKSLQRWITPYGMIITVVSMFLWFIPMSATGMVSAKLYTYPVIIRNQFRISCLFTYVSKSWPTAHYEILFEDQNEWKEGPLEGFFDIDLFGNRTRFNRILGASKGKYKSGKNKGKLYPQNKTRLQEMANYIAHQWYKQNPNSTDAQISKIRFTLANHPVGKKQCMTNEPWSRPKLLEVPKKYKRIVGTFTPQRQP